MTASLSPPGSPAAALMRYTLSALVAVRRGFITPEAGHRRLMALEWPADVAHLILQTWGRT